MQGCKTHVKKKTHKLTVRDLQKSKHETSRNPLAFRAIIFQKRNLSRIFKVLWEGDKVQITAPIKQDTQANTLTMGKKIP